MRLMFLILVLYLLSLAAPIPIFGSKRQRVCEHAIMRVKAVKTPTNTPKKEPRMLLPMQEIEIPMPQAINNVITKRQSFIVVSFVLL
jgi:hypothetical protein